MENQQFIKSKNDSKFPIPFSICSSSIFIDSTKFNKNIFNSHYSQIKSTVPTYQNQENLLAVSDVVKVNYNQSRKHKIFQNKLYKQRNKTRDRKKIFQYSEQNFKKQRVSCLPINLKIYHYGRINYGKAEERQPIYNHPTYPQQNQFHSNAKTNTHSIIDKLDSRYYDDQSEIIIQQEEYIPLRKNSSEFYQNLPSHLNHRVSIEYPIFHEDNFQQKFFKKNISPKNISKHNFMNTIQLDKNEDKNQNTHISKKDNLFHSEIPLQDFSKNQNNCSVSHQKQQKTSQRLSVLLISIFSSIILMLIITLFS